MKRKEESLKDIKYYMAYKDDPIRVAKSLVITRICPVSKKKVDVAMCWYCRFMSINGCIAD